MRQTDSLATRQQTSDEAFAVAPTGAAAEVLEAIRERPRCVDELMVDLGMSHSTCSARVNQLMRDHWILDSGMRTITRSGRTAIIWQASAHTPKRSESMRSYRPTRAELEERIERALAAIESGCGASAIRQILKGVA